MDAGTGLTVLGTALGSAKVLEKLLGPTAEYLGAGVLDWTKHRIDNVTQIFQEATTKLGDRIEVPGTIPPRVLKSVLNEGSFCEDKVATEYFGGVLASSRGDGRDDRGTALMSLLGRLSTYQIRSHFLFYSIIRVLYSGMKENLLRSEGRERLQTFVPTTAYAVGMNFGECDTDRVNSVFTHVMFGLSRETLIEPSFRFSSPEVLRDYFRGADSHGILFSPSVLGVELFLWAHGHGDREINEILNPALQLTSTNSVPAVQGVRSTEFKDRWA
jgi:hypothetical protein